MPKVVYYIDNDENSLTHYGRLGMKWGQHIFGRDAVGHDVVKRLSRTEKKANKRLLKSQKYKKKSDKYSNPLIRTSISDDLYWKNVRKTQKYETKANKILDKGRKFAKKANEVLGSEQLARLSEKDLNVGRKFALDFAKPRTKEEKINRAKEKGLFDIDFVERTQNIENASDSKFIKEYSRYLDDPENYKWKG